MDKTRSATKLNKVLLEPNGYGGTYVWLRRNIQVVRETFEDGLSQTMWEADEVSGLLPYTLTPEDAETFFDEIWEQLEGGNVDIAALKRKVDAMAETADTTTEKVALHDDVLAELASIVSDLAIGGGMNG